MNTARALAETAVAALPSLALTRLLAEAGLAGVSDLPWLVSLPTLACAGVVAMAAALVGALADRRRRRYDAPVGKQAAASLGAWPLVVAVVYVSLARPAPDLAPVAAAGAGALVLAAVCRFWWRPPLETLPPAAAGQIWWAQVPFEEKAGSKDRPVLILGGRRFVRVLMFTSADKQGRNGYLPVPAHVWRRPGQRSFLRLDRTIRLNRADLRRYEGELDEATLKAAGVRR